MLSRLRSSLAVFSVLLGAYLAYAHFAVPRFEPRHIRSLHGAMGGAVQSTVLTRHPELAALFPSNAWELGDPKVIETKQGLLLLQEHATDPQGRLRLRPCTLILYAVEPKDPAKQVEGSAPTSSLRPVILQAPEGASLEFDEPMDIRLARVGRLLGGHLHGPVRIFRPASGPEADDGLDVQTRNVQIDTQRIWTPHEVSFRMGAHEGAGQDLTVLLAPPPEGAKGSKRLAVGRVKSMELVHVRYMRMRIPATLWPEELRGSEPKAASPSAPANETIEITCRGPLQMDFGALVASFHDRVRVARLSATGPSDTLDCERLETHFVADAKLSKWTYSEGSAETMDAAPKRKDSKGAIDQKLASVRRIIAVGNPVTLKAPSAGAAARAGRVTCDLVKQHLMMEGGAPNGRVWLRYQGYEIDLPSLEYEWTDLRAIGQLRMQGPGRILGATPKRAKTPPAESRERKEASFRPASFELTWQRESRLIPHEGMHVASMIGDAKAIAYGEDGLKSEVGADELYVWLRPNGSKDFVVDRLLALGVVRLDAPQAKGSAGRVEVWFVDVPQFATTKQSSGDSDALGAAGLSQSGEKGMSLDVSANLIRVRALRSGDDMQLDEATLEGEVEVTAQTPQAGDEPLVLKGNLVRIEHGPAPNAQAAVVRVFGHPAVASGGGVAMYGANLQLDRGSSKFWVVGQGKMTFALQKLAAARQPGKDLSALPESGEIIWQHGLHFDGRVARMTGGVEARTGQQRLHSGTLDVTFNQAVDFGAMRAARDIQPATLRFDGGVFAESFLWKEGQLESIDQAQTVNLVLDVAERTLLGDGPGWVRTIRRGSAELARVGGGNASKDKSQSSSLFTAHIDFEDGVVGRAYDERLSQWDLRLVNRVQAGYRPAENWEDRLTSSDLQAVGPRGLVLSSRQFVVAEMGPPLNDVRQIEAWATGDTRIEGQMYNATANRLSYALAKDLIVLEGDGRADARLERRAGPNEPAVEAIARKILFWRRLNEVEVDEGKYLGVERISRPPSKSRLR